MQLSLQMVRLHRDPQGKKVFVLPQGVDNTDVETLRTRIRELETMLKDQKSTTVSIIGYYATDYNDCYT